VSRRYLSSGLGLGNNLPKGDACDAAASEAGSTLRSCTEQLGQQLTICRHPGQRLTDSREERWKASTQRPIVES
jgi:hypothetical protein